MPTPEQKFLIENNLRDMCIGVESSKNGVVVVDPKPICVSQAMRAWANAMEQNGHNDSFHVRDVEEKVTKGTKI